MHQILDEDRSQQSDQIKLSHSVSQRCTHSLTQSLSASPSPEREHEHGVCCRDPTLRASALGTCGGGSEGVGPRLLEWPVWPHCLALATAA